jgi:hypothetical protein
VNTTFRGRSIAIVALVVFCILLNGTSSAQVRGGLPSELSDQEFWRTVTEFSEPSGPYTGDNWISNEASIQQVIPPLKQLAKPGGVYLGVGPEQNFTYGWALQSKFAFITGRRSRDVHRSDDRNGQEWSGVELSVNGSRLSVHPGNASQEPHYSSRGKFRGSQDDSADFRLS